MSSETRSNGVHIARAYSEFIITLVANSPIMRAIRAVPFSPSPTTISAIAGAGYSSSYLFLYPNVEHPFPWKDHLGLRRLLCHHLLRSSTRPLRRFSAYPSYKFTRGDRLSLQSLR